MIPTILNSHRQLRHLYHSLFDSNFLRYIHILAHDPHQRHLRHFYNRQLLILFRHYLMILKLQIHHRPLRHLCHFLIDSMCFRCFHTLAHDPQKFLCRHFYNLQLLVLFHHYLVMLQIPTHPLQLRPLYHFLLDSNLHYSYQQ